MGSVGTCIIRVDIVHEPSNTALRTEVVIGKCAAIDATTGVWEAGFWDQGC
jgi:hypothetical protein